MPPIPRHQILHTGQTTLEPRVAAGAHAYPFTFTISPTTLPMKENDAYMVNRWKAEPPFLGHEEMHPLPPTFQAYRKSLMGSQQAVVRYSLEATCVKGVKHSSLSLPQ